MALMALMALLSRLAAVKPLDSAAVTEVNGRCSGEGVAGGGA